MTVAGAFPVFFVFSLPLEFSCALLPGSSNLIGNVYQVKNIILQLLV